MEESYYTPSPSVHVLKSALVLPIFLFLCLLSQPVNPVSDTNFTRELLDVATTVHKEESLKVTAEIQL